MLLFFELPSQKEVRRGERTTSNRENRKPEKEQNALGKSIRCDVCTALASGSECSSSKDMLSARMKTYAMLFLLRELE